MWLQCSVCPVCLCVLCDLCDLSDWCGSCVYILGHSKSIISFWSPTRMVFLKREALFSPNPMRMTSRAQPRPASPSHSTQYLGWPRMCVRAMHAYVRVTWPAGNFETYVGIFQLRTWQKLSKKCSLIVWSTEYQWKWRNPSRLKFTILNHVGYAIKDLSTTMKKCLHSIGCVLWHPMVYEDQEQPLHQAVLRLSFQKPVQAMKVKN